mgnify:CR=1 FL=1
MNVLDRLPPMSTLQTYVKEGRLKKELDAIHPLTYLLLRWIMNCSEAHIYEKQYAEDSNINSNVAGLNLAESSLSNDQNYDQHDIQNNNMVNSPAVTNKFQLFGIHCTPPRKVNPFTNNLVFLNEIYVANCRNDYFRCMLGLAQGMVTINLS